MHKAFDRVYEGTTGEHTITDVGPSRTRTAADHSTVSTHLDLVVTKGANLPDMRTKLTQPPAAAEVGESGNGCLVCSSAFLSTRGMGATVPPNGVYLCGQTLSLVSRV